MTFTSVPAGTSRCVAESIEGPTAKDDVRPCAAVYFLSGVIGFNTPDDFDGLPDWIVPLLLEYFLSTTGDPCLADPL